MLAHASNTFGRCNSPLETQQGDEIAHAHLRGGTDGVRVASPGERARTVRAVGAFRRYTDPAKRADQNETGSLSPREGHCVALAPVRKEKGGNRFAALAPRNPLISRRKQKESTLVSAALQGPRRRGGALLCAGSRERGEEYTKSVALLTG